MSKSEVDAHSDEAGYQDPPHGRPFDSETARDAIDLAWRSRRKDKLKEHGLWETWRCVPPKPDRDKPIQEYLPGGSEYDV